MKVKEIRAMSSEELNSNLEELKKELMRVNTEASVSNPKNPSRIGKIRRTIARIITIKNQKKPREVDKKA